MKMIFSFILFVLVGCQGTPNKIEKNIVKEEMKQVEDTIHVEYYANGSKKVMAELQNKKFHGKYYAFYSNGKISESGIMIDGAKNGVWKFFDKNEKIKNVYQYYNDKIVFELDKVDFTFVKQKIDNNSVEIELPFKWERKKSNNTQVLLVAQKKCNEEVKFCPNIVITKEIIDQEIDYRTYLENSLEILKNKLPEFKIVSQGQVTRGGRTGFQVTYLGSIEGVKLGGITTWVFDSKKVYVVTGMANNQIDSEFLKYKGLFQEVSNSLIIN